MKSKSHFDDDFQSHKSTDIVRFNLGAEKRFVSWLIEKINSLDEPPSVGWVIANSAYKLNLSIETTKRYLIKHTADEAEFFIYEGIVQIRRFKKINPDGATHRN